MDDWIDQALSGNAREVPLGPPQSARLAASRCDDVVAQLTEKIRTWCREQGMQPHPALDIVASVALALAAGGMGIGPGFYDEMMRRSRAQDTPDGALGLGDAASQVIEYLSSATPPLEP